MRNFKLSGAGIEVQAKGNQLIVQGEGLREGTFSDIAVSTSDIGETITVVLLESSRNGTRSVLQLVVPNTTPSKEDLSITGVAILVQDFRGLVGGAPAVLQKYDVKPLTGTMPAVD